MQAVDGSPWVLGTAAVDGRRRGPAAVKSIAASSLFIVAALAAACGSTAGGGTTTQTPIAARQPNTTATPTPSPTPDLQAQAAQTYLQAATTANNADAAIPNGDLLSNPGTASTLSQLVPPVQAYVSIDQTFLNSLYAIKFPAADQLDVNAFIRDLTAEIAGGQEFATDPNSANWETFANIDTSSDANVLRHDLGLPQVSAS
jgi:hypothetical protein